MKTYLLIIAFLLSGCGGSDSSNQSNTAPNQPQSNTEQVIPQANIDQSNEIEIIPPEDDTTEETAQEPDVFMEIGSAPTNTQALPDPDPVPVPEVVRDPQPVFEEINNENIQIEVVEVEEIPQHLIDQYDALGWFDQNSFHHTELNANQLNFVAYESAHDDNPSESYLNYSLEVLRGNITRYIDSIYNIFIPLYESYYINNRARVLTMIENDQNKMEDEYISHLRFLTGFNNFSQYEYETVLNTGLQESRTRFQELKDFILTAE